MLIIHSINIPVKKIIAPVLPVILPKDIKYNYGDINAVTVYIRKIREKIERNPSKPIYIITVWGVGYKFDGSSV